MLKRTMKQRLYGAKVCIRQFRRKRKLQKVLFFALLVVSINFLTAACGQGETLTLKTATASAEETGGSRDGSGVQGGSGVRGGSEDQGGSEARGGSEVRDGSDETGGAAEKSRDAGTLTAGNSGGGSSSDGEGTFSEASPEESAAAPESAREPLYVYVCGAVERPGVYSFPDGARVCDAIAAAGGLTPEADETCVNQALKLSDQDQIYIRTLEEKERAPETEEAGGVLHAGAGSSADAEKEPGEAGPSGNGSVKINLNTATQQELMSLRGIGETKAAAILAYRQEHGFFARTEDLKKVSGIGDATYEKLKDQITAQSP